MYIGDSHTVPNSHFFCPKSQFYISLYFQLFIYIFSCLMSLVIRVTNISIIFDFLDKKWNFLTVWDWPFSAQRGKTKKISIETNVVVGLLDTQYSAFLRFWHFFWPFDVTSCSQCLQFRSKVSFLKNITIWIFASKMGLKT